MNSRSCYIWSIFLSDIWTYVLNFLMLIDMKEGFSFLSGISSSRSSKADLLLLRGDYLCADAFYSCSRVSFNYFKVKSFWHFKIDLLTLVIIFLGITKFFAFCTFCTSSGSNRLFNSSTSSTSDPPRLRLVLLRRFISSCFWKCASPSLDVKRRDK